MLLYPRLLQNAVLTVGDAACASAPSTVVSEVNLSNFAHSGCLLPKIDSLNEEKSWSTEYLQTTTRYGRESINLKIEPNSLCESVV